jgi:hypothetical protein
MDGMRLGCNRILMSSQILNQYLQMFEYDFAYLVSVPEMKRVPKANFQRRVCKETPNLKSLSIMTIFKNIPPN